MRDATNGGRLMLTDAVPVCECGHGPKAHADGNGRCYAQAGFHRTWCGCMAFRRAPVVVRRGVGRDDAEQWCSAPASSSDCVCGSDHDCRSEGCDPDCGACCG